MASYFLPCLRRFVLPPFLPFVVANYLFSSVLHCVMLPVYIYPLNNKGLPLLLLFTLHRLFVCLFFAVAANIYGTESASKQKEKLMKKDPLFFLQK